ncbi:MAG: nitroreductase family deazaflavin-dependent oxidoreductase [Acidimicrobiia bacterium]|nr:nitroreductase family deazaflavin-dependent oxidoreductase [Acidimicrobiia bacterium]
MAVSLRPGWFVRKVMNPLIARLGMATTLAVTGRTSGAERTVPVNVLEHEGARYLLSPRGETDWVRNLRAAGEGELRRRGHSERVRVSDVPIDERAPLIEAYRAKWDSQVRRFFEQLPDPGDHPTFLVDTSDN